MIFAVGECVRMICELVVGECDSVCVCACECVCVSVTVCV